MLAGYSTVVPGSVIQIRAGFYPENLTLTKRIWLRSGGGGMLLGQ